MFFTERLIISRIHSSERRQKATLSPNFLLNKTESIHAETHQHNTNDPDEGVSRNTFIRIVCVVLMCFCVNALSFV